MNKNHKIKNILGIDRGSKYIGLAYLLGGTQIVFPIGYLENDSTILYNIADYLVRYKISKIIIGYPNKQLDIQDKINKFIQNLEYIIGDKIAIHKIEEDYTSVQAGEIVSNYKKNCSTDTISAMILLERYLAQINSTNL